MTDRPKQDEFDDYVKNHNNYDIENYLYHPFTIGGDAVEFRFHDMLYRRCVIILYFDRIILDPMSFDARLKKRFYYRDYYNLISMMNDVLAYAKKGAMHYHRKSTPTPPKSFINMLAVQSMYNLNDDSKILAKF